VDRGLGVGLGLLRRGDRLGTTGLASALGPGSLGRLVVAVAVAVLGGRTGVGVRRRRGLAGRLRRRPELPSSLLRGGGDPAALEESLEEVAPHHAVQIGVPAELVLLREVLVHPGQEEVLAARAEVDLRRLLTSHQDVLQLGKHGSTPALVRHVDDELVELPPQGVDGQSAQPSEGPAQFARLRFGLVHESTPHAVGVQGIAHGEVVLGEPDGQRRGLVRLRLVFADAERQEGVQDPLLTEVELALEEPDLVLHSQVEERDAALLDLDPEHAFRGVGILVRILAVVGRDAATRVHERRLSPDVPVEPVPFLRLGRRLGRLLLISLLRPRLLPADRGLLLGRRKLLGPHGRQIQDLRVRPTEQVVGNRLDQRELQRRKLLDDPGPCLHTGDRCQAQREQTEDPSLPDRPHDHAHVIRGMHDRRPVFENLGLTEGKDATGAIELDVRDRLHLAGSEALRLVLVDDLDLHVRRVHGANARIRQRHVLPELVVPATGRDGADSCHDHERHPRPFRVTQDVRGDLAPLDLLWSIGMIERHCDVDHVVLESHQSRVLLGQHRQCRTVGIGIDVH